MKCKHCKLTDDQIESEIMHAVVAHPEIYKKVVKWQKKAWPELSE